MAAILERQIEKKKSKWPYEMNTLTQSWYNYQDFLLFCYLQREVTEAI